MPLIRGHLLDAIGSVIALHPTHAEGGEVGRSCRAEYKDGVVEESTMKTTRLQATELARAASGTGTTGVNEGGAPGAKVVMIAEVGSEGEATIAATTMDIQDEVEGGRVPSASSSTTRAAEYLRDENWSPIDSCCVL